MTGPNSAQKRKKQQDLQRSEDERIASIQDNLRSQTSDLAAFTQRAPLFRNGFVVR